MCASRRKQACPVREVRQCNTCPWRVGADTADIPRYRRELHERLRSTIADGVDVLDQLRSGGAVRVMACHYSTDGAERACAGWLDNQLGPGNNVLVRLAVHAGRLPVPVVRGKQRATFDETLCGE